MWSKIILAVIIAILFLYKSDPRRKIVIFHAGSLSRPVAQLIREFEEEHPDFHCVSEASGSRVCCFKISALNKKADLILSADYNTIDSLLIPDHCDWHVSFAVNRMVIAYNEHSKYGNSINEHNWYEILAKSDVEFGHSAPNLDPAGYRTILCWQLADLHYPQLKSGFSISGTLAANCPEKNIRPMSVALISMLENYNLDYAFEYQSVALQYNLKYLNLPREIDLSDPDLNELYRKATLKVTGSEPGSIKLIRGSAIRYAGTIPFCSENPNGAKLFMEFLLSERGREIFRKNFQEPLIPALASNLTKVPKQLRKYCIQTE